MTYNGKTYYYNCKGEIFSWQEINKMQSTPITPSPSGSKVTVSTPGGTYVYNNMDWSSNILNGEGKSIGGMKFSVAKYIVEGGNKGSGGKQGWSETREYDNHWSNIKSRIVRENIYTFKYNGQQYSFNKSGHVYTDDEVNNIISNGNNGDSQSNPETNIPETPSLNPVQQLKPVQEKEIKVSDKAYTLFVKDLYSTVLKREASQTEIDNCKKQSVHKTAIQILLSDEANNKNGVKGLNNDELVQYVFRYVLGREGGSGSSFVDMLDAGYERKDVITNIVNAQEFNIRMNVYEQKVKQQEESLKKAEQQTKNEREERRSKIKYMSDGNFKKYIEHVLTTIMGTDKKITEEDVKKWLDIYQDGYDIEVILERIICKDNIDKLNSLSNEDYVKVINKAVLYKTPNMINIKLALNYLTSNGNRNEYVKSEVLNFNKFKSIKQQLIDGKFNFKGIVEEELVDKIHTEVKGDLTGDTIINGSDATLLLHVILEISVTDDESKWAEKKDTLDIDNDGVVNTQDALALLRYYTLISSRYDKSLDEFVNSDEYKEFKANNKEN